MNQSINNNNDVFHYLPSKIISLLTMYHIITIFLRYIASLLYYRLFIYQNIKNIDKIRTSFPWFMLRWFLDRPCALPYSKCYNLFPPINLFFSLLVLLSHNNIINATIVGVFCSDFIIEARYYFVVGFY